MCLLATLPSPQGELCFMTFRGVGLLFLILTLGGCAYLEGPRWAMLGDTSEQAFFIDREDVQRLPNGNYSYPVKIRPYVEGRPHQLDEGRDTSQVLFIEMSCREKRWTETGRGSMDSNGKILFRRLNTSPVSRPVEEGTIHLAAYIYLCGDDDIPVQHNH